IPTTVPSDTKRGTCAVPSVSCGRPSRRASESRRPKLESRRGHRLGAGIAAGHFVTRGQRMIKVSVMYENKPNARFDHEYYKDKHMPLVKERMGDSCKFYTVDRGVAGGAPG